LAGERLRQQGFLVHTGELESLGLQAGGYDVVLMSEILEHIPKPRRALEEVHSLLRPGGALYLTTPNIGSLARRVLGSRWGVIAVPEHLHYFDLASLRRLLTSVGFEVAAISTEGMNPFDLWADLRSRGGRATVAASAEALRDLANTCGPASVAKSTLNALLGAVRLGDTLKALATKR
jgi:SAM-dependent methyltransferase